MGEALSAETADAVREAITGSVRSTNTYNAARPIKAPAWMKETA